MSNNMSRDDKCFFLCRIEEKIKNTSREQQISFLILFLCCLVAYFQFGIDQVLYIDDVAIAPQRKLLGFQTISYGRAGVDICRILLSNGVHLPFLSIFLTITMLSCIAVCSATIFNLKRVYEIVIVGCCIVINPYFSGMVMFNVFRLGFVFAFLAATIAAYFSIKSKLKYKLFSGCFLVVALMTYQSSFNFYLALLLGHHLLQQTEKLSPILSRKSIMALVRAYWIPIAFFLVWFAGYELYDKLGIYPRSSFYYVLSKPVELNNFFSHIFVVLINIVRFVFHIGNNGWVNGWNFLFIPLLFIVVFPFLYRKEFKLKKRIYFVVQLLVVLLVVACLAQLHGFYLERVNTGVLGNGRHFAVIGLLTGLMLSITFSHRNLIVHNLSVVIGVCILWLGILAVNTQASSLNFTRQNENQFFTRLMTRIASRPDYLRIQKYTLAYAGNVHDLQLVPLKRETFLIKNMWRRNVTGDIRSAQYLNNLYRTSFKQNSKRLMDIDYKKHPQWPSLGAIWVSHSKKAIFIRVGR